MSPNIGYIVTVSTENCLYGSIQLKTDYIVVLSPENWLHTLIYEIAIFHSINGESCDKLIFDIAEGSIFDRIRRLSSSMMS